MAQPAKEKESKSINGRGGRRAGAGRPKGRKNAETIEIELAAKAYGGDALRALAEIARDGDSEAARVSAASALLDRGYGRARQSVDHRFPELPAAERADRVAELVTIAKQRAGLATNGNGKH